MLMLLSRGLLPIANNTMVFPGMIILKYDLFDRMFPNNIYSSDTEVRPALPIYTKRNVYGLRDKVFGFEFIHN